MAWYRLFYVETDFIGVGLGVALTHEYGAYICLPVAYASCTLLDAERRYSLTEREKLFIVWAVYYFKSYIMGMTFVVITDYSALQALKTKEK